MAPTGFLAVTRREIAWLATQPWEQALLVWVPILSLALILGLFSAGVPTGLPIALVDEDHSVASRELARRVAATRSVAIAEQPPSLAAAWPLLRQGDVYGVLHIPQHWHRDRLRGQALPAVFYNNAQYYLVAGVTGSSVQAAVTAMLLDDAVASEARFGGGIAQATQRVNALVPDLRTLYNPALSYEAYLGGMMTPAILHLFAVIAAVSALGREFRRRSVAEWLAASGDSLPLAVAGKLAPTLAVYLVLSLALLVTLAGWRGWSAAGSFVLWYAGIALLMLSSLAVAVLLVGATANLRTSLSLTGVCVATALAYSGFSFPQVAMDAPGRFWSSLLPFTYYLQLQQGQWQSGADLAAWARTMAALGADVAAPLALGWPLLARNCRRPEKWGAL